MSFNKFFCGLGNGKSAGSSRNDCTQVDFVDLASWRLFNHILDRIGKVLWFDSSPSKIKLHVHCKLCHFAMQ